MKMTEVLIIALIATISALMVWFILFTATGGNDGPFAQFYTALLFPPIFAVLFLFIHKRSNRRNG